MKAAVIMWFLTIMFCVACATFLIYRGIKGWGWVLVVAVLIASMNFNSKEKSDDTSK